MRAVINYIRKKVYLIYLKKKRNGIGRNVFLNLNTKLEGGNRIGANSEVTDTLLGYGSYCGSYCLLQKCIIGKYCSIGHRVKVIISTHPTDKFVSTHPAFYEPLYYKQKQFNYVDTKKFNDSTFIQGTNYCIHVGNDVWIGSDVRILHGVKIGDGAIIAAGALINKDIEPYTIVGGIPARKIRDRFSDEEKRILLDLKWWEKDELWLKKHADLFSNIESFIKIITDFE